MPHPLLGQIDLPPPYSGNRGYPLQWKMTLTWEYVRWPSHAQEGITVINPTSGMTPSPPCLNYGVSANSCLLR